jgi:hypothetical protein
VSRFNVAATKPAKGTGPIGTVGPDVTHEGAPGSARDEKSELFLLAVTNMVGEKTFYESADQRDERFERLVRAVAVADPAWMLGFVGWLRSGANMRTASVVAAAEAVKARLDAKLPSVPAYEVPGHSTDRGVERTLVDVALQRADEPGELLAYWTSRYGRKIPKPVKRGAADAVTRLYNEYALLKYDTASKGYRFADVIDLVHPSPKAPWQGILFMQALERRHNRPPQADRNALPMLTANEELRAEALGDLSVLLDAERLKAAGMTWEDVLSLAGSKLPKGKLWEALIPSMGFMALLRNLRGFDEAGVSDAVAQTVAAKLADPAQVARSRQLPMRFLSAYRAAPSLRWSYPLEQALGHSLTNIPELAGRTLILIDVSGSMTDGFSKDGTLHRWDAAALFGLALAQRCAHPDVVAFDGQTSVFKVQRVESVLKGLERFRSEGHFRGGGTQTTDAVRRHYTQHDRVVVLTDEQYGGYWVGDPGSVLPPTTPLYTWNLAGYQAGHTAAKPGRWTFGGLTDAGFRMIPLIERGVDGHWPWL